MTWEVAASTKRTTERKRDTSTLRRLDAIIESDGGKRRTQAILRANRTYIIELYRDRGLNTPQIGKLLKVPARSVYDTLRRAGIRSRRQQAQAAMGEHRDTIIERYNRGDSVESISRATGIFDVSVRNVLRRAGIKLTFGPRPSTCCRECGKPKVQGTARCIFHLRLYKAAINRESYRRVKQVPPERQRVEPSSTHTSGTSHL